MLAKRFKRVNKNKRFIAIGTIIIGFLTAAIISLLVLKSKGIINSAKVSVVIPVYNTEKYLDECLNSVENQTLKEIEIICVNDGSTDNSLSVLEKHRSKDRRIKIVNQKNAGVSAARNAGIKKASGEYIAFLDSDDIVVPWAYERAYGLATKHNVDIVEFDFHGFIDGEETGASSLSYRESSFEIKERNPSEKPFQPLDFNVDIVWNKLWKRSFIKSNDFSFKKGINRGEDTLFNMIAASSVFKTVRDKNQLYCYRTSRPGSAMTVTQKDGKKRLESYIIMLEGLNEKRNKIKFEGSDQWILSSMLYLVYSPISYDLDNAEDKKYYAEKSLEIINDFLKKYDITPEGDNISMMNNLKSFL